VQGCGGRWLAGVVVGFLQGFRWLAESVRFALTPGRHELDRNRNSKKQAVDPDLSRTTAVKTASLMKSKFVRTDRQSNPCSTC
jgi:hypothetical protein